MIRARTATLLAAIAGLLCLMVAPVPAVASTARADATTAPLKVTLTGIRPGAIPKKGRIRITGTVRNTTHHVWRNIHVYPLTSYQPITSGSDLADAADSDPTSVIGDRLVDLGRKVGALAPGATAHFRIRVPVDKLKISGAPGVYWLGVHALGTSRDGSDGVADGRARTFIPLVPKQAHTVAEVSLVLPLAQSVARTPDGKVADAGALAHSTTDGRLARLLGFARASGSTPLTWLVDPAVVAAVEDVASGNAGVGVAKAEDTEPSSSATPVEPSPPASDAALPSQSPDGSPSAGPSGATGSPGAGLSDAERTAARKWLSGWTTTTKSNGVLALPFGDVDVSSITAKHRRLLSGAWKLGDKVLADRSITAGHAVDPADGYLRPRSARLLGKDTTVLLQDHGSAHPAVRKKGVHYVYADTGAMSGGPAPGNRTSVLQMRQRVLAESAINVLRHDTDPLIVTFPDDWRAGTPAADAKFFRGLDVPWLVATSLPSGTKANDDDPDSQLRLDWPAKSAEALLPSQNLDAARQLSRLADASGNLFDDDGIARTLHATALSAVSSYARTAPVDARIAVQDADDWMQALLSNIDVEGTEFVVLSGGSGVLTVAVHNGLDKAIQVGLASRADDPKITFTAPDQIKLSPDSRTAVRLHAHARAVGVHEVTLSATTKQGQHVGTPLVFSVRTSQIGRVFWYVLVGGMVVLALLVARRVRQRIRARRATADE